jgi:hypothetical protein
MQGAVLVLTHKVVRIVPGNLHIADVVEASPEVQSHRRRWVVLQSTGHEALNLDTVPEPDQSERAVLVRCHVGRQKVEP